MRNAPPPLGDRDLVEAIRSRKAGAEDEFVRRYRNAVRSMMFARTRDHEDAEDLAQDTLLAALRSIRHGSLTSQERLGAFVRGTARNVLNSYFRMRERRPSEVPLPEDLPAGPDASHLESDERLALALEALAEQTDLDRRILRMSLVDGLTPSEIARELLMSPELVRTHKSRAAHRLTAGIGAPARPGHAMR